MFNAHNITVSFGGETLFDEISFRLGKGDRVGLIGKNGAGKSTLLKLMAKENQPTSGTFALEKNCKIGYLPQDLDFENGRSVLEEAYLAFDEIKKIEERQVEIHKIMELTEDFESTSYLEVLDELTELNNHFEMIGGYHYQAHTEKILLGLGFSVEELNAPTDTFSGGWRMRIELAKLLLKDNDILLLDEPTNHLDMDMRQALTVALQDFSGAIVLISHDRHLLANTVDEFLIINEGKVDRFNGDLIDYRKMILNGPSKATSNNSKNMEDKVKDKKDLKRIKTQIVTIEKTLKRLNRKLAETLELLNSPELYNDSTKMNLHDLLRDQVNLDTEIKSTEQEWLELNEELENS